MVRSDTNPSPDPSAAASESAPEEAKAAPAANPEEDALSAAKREASENHDRYMRAVADLENFRRRATRERDDLRSFANARLIEELLPVLDNLSLGLTAARQAGADTDALVGGVEMVITQFKGALANHGLKEINPQGEKFDPHQQEAISHQPDAKIPEEHVIQVVRPGFSLNGRLLRPASVVVSSGPAGKPASSA